MNWFIQNVNSTAKPTLDLDNKMDGILIQNGTKFQIASTHFLNISSIEQPISKRTDLLIHDEIIYNHQT